ncbi:Fic family protein [Tunicatimonas pelagia]|uniref:Fic family protein n=1 Tax=Tunicatimonas pelagia TaxID=931531 RepID=UPI0026663367|nr:Fic family protein [Tunicatimonas pelagia]WKN41527.1 Fic family protein [Tunicatimonas pelagia]
MSEINRIWRHISFSDEWAYADTSVLDEIAPSWFSRREVLLENSKEYQDFMNRLKRRHAIETGVVERMYDIEKGVTETLINEGFLSSLISHGDTNIEKKKLLSHLDDHLEAVDFIFDVVKENRPLTKGFILELHQLTTRHQEFAEGRGQFGNKTKIALIKGKFKERENNPTRPDGIVVKYCPPDHVEAEMDNLIKIYEGLIEQKVHPLIVASWVHHAFTTIHPFQDGNGRVVRLIASLILIKANYFPVTVLREEAKEKYIKSLEESDAGSPQRLVTYFGEIQRRNIEEVLNLREVSQTSLDEVTNIFKQKLLDKGKHEQAQHKQLLADRRLQIYTICNEFLNSYKDQLETGFDDSVTFYIGSGRPDDSTRQHYYYHQIVRYANQHNYFFNRNLPKSYFIFGFNLRDGQKYELGISIHHYGYDDSTIAIGAFLEYKSTSGDDTDSTAPLSIKPHIISITDDAKPKEKNIKAHLESILTVTIAQIASEV